MRRVLPALLLLVVALPAQTVPDRVTFTEHVASIVFARCTSCHRPGEIGPFPLMTYEDVAKRARMILRVIDARLMPPWSPEPGHGTFVGERRLTGREISILRRWVEGGKAAGDPGKLPPIPSYADGWQLGKPDLVVTMKDAFEVPASGPDVYRNFVVPLDLEEDRWVVGYEFRPSARSVVHHSLVNFDTTGRARRRDGRDGKPGFRGMGGGRSGSLGIWAVGAMPHKLPEGLAIKLPKGADLVLSTHFHLSGKVERERHTVGLYFAEAPPSRSLVNLQMPPLWGAVVGIDIPAGEKAYKVRDHQVLPVACDAVEVSSHAHQVCTDMRAWATLPDGKTRNLFYIARWDFDWQGGYTYRSPVALPAGTRVDVEFTYDNSSDNPSNPNDPPQRIRYGQRTADEMARITLMLVPRDQKDAAELEKACNRRNRVRAVWRRRRR